MTLYEKVKNVKRCSQGRGSASVRSCTRWRAPAQPGGTYLLLRFPGQRCVVLLQRGHGEVGGGQLPVHGVPDGRVSVSCSQGPQRFQVVVHGLGGGN